MKKHICKIWSVVLAALLCMAMLPVSVFAAGSVIATATIPVSVLVSGEEGTLDSGDIPEETYTFKLTTTNNAPMPESDTVTITGAGSAEFTIDYETVGVYKYTLTQDSSALSGENSTCNDRGNYDSAVYYVTVTVQNDAQTGGIGVVVVAHKDSTTGDKCDIEYENTYDPVPYTSITVNKTWTDNDQTRPTSISVQLLDGEEVVDTVTLKEGNNWTYTWSLLDPYGEHSWDVKEVAVSGYTAEYTTSDGTITIHNVGDKVTTTTEETEDTDDTEDDDPGVTTETTSAEPAQTGDTANIALYVVVMIAAAAVVIVLTIYNKKKRTE